MANIEGIIYALQHRDRSNDHVVVPQQESFHAEATTVFHYILLVVERIVGAGSVVPKAAEPYIKAVQEYFNLRTPEEASLLCAFCNLMDDNKIRIRDLAELYRVHSLVILNSYPEINRLVKRGFILRRKDSGNSGNNVYRITEEVVRMIQAGEAPEIKDVSGLDIWGFCSELDVMLERFRHCEIGVNDLEEAIRHLISVNGHLHISKTLQRYDLEFANMLLLLVMTTKFINNHDDNICKMDIDDYFSQNLLRLHCFHLETGEHTLMYMNLVEHACSDGMVVTSEWKLTDECKRDLLKELNLKSLTSNHGITRYVDIPAKRLFYNERVGKEVLLLESLLKPRRMQRVLQALEDNGMRKGFCCLLYGSPGTGKTETVQQLARQTKRDIMLVDIPNVRSKWVGDTEKNIKRVFDNYRSVVREDPVHAPILLFNEADAILSKRNAGSSSVDKMENSMLNIVLEEMERFEGILIATTNLIGNLDPAFERRFLYKIEFDKPMPAERQLIWRSMISGLTKKQAQHLAQRYDFSGGQIENVARKRIVSDIIWGRATLDFDDVIQSCENELLDKSNKKKIGFIS